MDEITLLKHQISAAEQSIKQQDIEIDNLKREIKVRDTRIIDINTRLSQEKARNEALFEVIEKLISELKG